jgi:SnoaL-like domain
VSDYEEIVNLLHSYPELLNTGQFDAVGELFRYGSVSVVGNPNRYVGAEEVAAMYRESTVVPPTGPDSLLYTSNLRVEIDGDTASARSYFMAFHQKPGNVISPVVGGRYEDTLARQDGRWVWKERVMRLDLIGDLAGHLAGSIDDYVAK